MLPSPDNLTAILAVGKTQKQPGTAVDNAAKENKRQAVKKIQNCKPLLDKMMDNGTLEVVGAFYDLDTGKAEPIK